MNNAHLIMRIFTVKYDGMGLQILRRLYDIPRKHGGNSMQPPQNHRTFQVLRPRQGGGSSMALMGTKEPNMGDP